MIITPGAFISSVARNNRNGAMPAAVNATVDCGRPLVVWI